MLVFLIEFKPLSDSRSMKVEIFNELTQLVLLYILIMFTSITEYEGIFRNNIGIVYLFVIFSNIGTHVYLMAYDSYKRFEKRYRKRCCCCRKKA